MKHINKKIIKMNTQPSLMDDDPVESKKVHLQFY